MKFFSMLTALLLASSMAFSQGKEAVAVVNGKKITLDDFNKRYNEVKKSTANPPPKSVFLEDLVRYEVGLQEAEKKKVDQDPDVQDRMRQEVYKAFLEKELGDKVQKITVTDKEMQAFYKDNPEVRISHILIEIKPGATAEQKAEAKKRANEIYEEVKGSKRPFEELVRLYTDDVISKQTGGDVGWQTRVTIMPNVYESVIKMKVGEIKGLFETQFGFHIVKVTGKRSFESANKRQLRAAVFDEKRKDVFNAFFGGLKKKYKIEVNSKLVE